MRPAAFLSASLCNGGLFRAQLDRCHLPCYATVVNISRHQKTLKVLSYTTTGPLAASHSNRRAGRRGGDVSIKPLLYSCRLPQDGASRDVRGGGTNGTKQGCDGVRKHFFISLFKILDHQQQRKQSAKFFFFKEVKIHMSIGQDALDENSL